MKTCSRCKGVGKENGSAEDVKTGAAMRKKREKTGISLRAIANVLEVSPSYLSLLETGKQRWNVELEKKYLAAIKVDE